jgi:hypothetical protein
MESIQVKTLSANVHPVMYSPWFHKPHGIRDPTVISYKFMQQQIYCTRLRSGNDKDRGEQGTLMMFFTSPSTLPYKNLGSLGNIHSFLHLYRSVDTGSELLLGVLKKG